jgi:hypothetical protein
LTTHTAVGPATRVTIPFTEYRALAAAPTYAELERRRAVTTRPALTPHQIRAQAAASWARVEQWIATREAA